jgi:hypothetical protein
LYRKKNTNAVFCSFFFNKTFVRDIDVEYVQDKKVDYKSDLDNISFQLMIVNMSHKHNNLNANINHYVQQNEYKLNHPMLNIYLKEI